IAEKNDYLQITSPALWSLDDFATWCGSCEVLEGSKVKIVDHMKKRLEKTKSNIYIKDDMRKKATDLYEDFQRCWIEPENCLSTGRSTVCLSFSLVSYGTLGTVCYRCWTKKWKFTKTTADFFQELSIQYQTKKQLELVENQKVIELAEIERMKVTQLKNNTESVMKIHQHVADGFVEFSKEMNRIKKRILEDSESNSSDIEDTTSIKDGETTSTKRAKLSDQISINSDFTFESIESTNYDFGLGNYKEGTEIDPDLSFQETDEDLTMPASERFFNDDTWRHPLRPEVWGIIHCGFKIAKLGWCSTDDYAEIQRLTRRATVSSCSEIISKLLKFKSLDSLEKSLKEIQLLNNFNDIIKEDSRKLILDELKTSDILFPLKDPFENFFIKILSIFQWDIFPDDSVIQQPNVSESNYGSYMIHPFLKCALFGMEKFLYYHAGEIALSSVKSCRERRKCNTLFEQKADGIFFTRLKKSFIEIGHLEMSGGYGHKDFSRSTWDGCCKLPIGNAYMLEEIGERFRGASCETFSKISVFSLHTYENRIELWRMYVPSCGVLQYERTHRATVPICFEDERKCIFDFVVVLWDLRCWLQEVTEVIYKLREEHNDSDVNASNLSSDILPPHPFTPQKDIHKKVSQPLM
ncbi:11436_t:CDS:10, partial [Acaulospora morrowiae]